MSVWRYLGMASILALGPIPAMGASFDCTKAQTPFEHAICEAPELSRADEVLAKAFATAIGGLTQGSLEAMRGDQRNWLDYARRACTADAQPLTKGRYDENGTACLLETFKGRISALEQSRMISGHRFFIQSAYGAVPDPDEVDVPDSNWKLATHEMVLPLLDADDPIAEEFNAFVLEGAKDVSESMGLSVEGDLSALDGRTDDASTISIQEVAGTGRISLEENSYYYPHRAAHGGSMITYRHYLVGEERALQASDLFSGADWEKTLVDLAWEQLQIQHKEWLQVDSAEDIATIVVDPARWDLSDKYGLTIQFNQYEIAAYAYGVPTITIPWEKLEAITAENHTAILYGF
ncbi:DUF3298 domain-containing protein [Devosia submarina]|uniref:DUF3298 domain-containing protein n=1 Tax=Devosia submarina TaxID=1173082 RepID=UPI000D33EDC6|nr:DUF3298 domain-containing protein [Devosia submarina]